MAYGQSFECNQLFQKSLLPARSFWLLHSLSSLQLFVGLLLACLLTSLVPVISTCQPSPMDSVFTSDEEENQLIND